MDNAGLLAAGEEPTPEQYVKALNRLNDLVNYFQTKGIKLWLNSLQTIQLTAGVASYTFPVPVKRMLEAYYFDNSVPSISRPLNILSWNTYETLGNPGQLGPVNSIFVNKQIIPTVTLWLVPDAQAATGTVRALVQTAVKNVVSLTDDMAFPNEWYMALHWGLAAEICTGQPEQIVQRCEKKAEAYRIALEDWDVEDASVTFSPDMRQRRPSGFR